MEHFRSNNEHISNVMNIQISAPKKVYSLDSWFYSCSFTKFFNKIKSVYGKDKLNFQLHTYSPV